MGTFEKLVGTMLALVALYLLLTNPEGVNQIFRALSATGVSIFSTLQGRGGAVEGVGFTSGGGGRGVGGRVGIGQGGNPFFEFGSPGYGLGRGIR